MLQSSPEHTETVAESQSRAASHCASQPQHQLRCDNGWNCWRTKESRKKNLTCPKKKNNNILGYCIE